MCVLGVISVLEVMQRCQLRCRSWEECFCDHTLEFTLVKKGQVMRRVSFYPYATGQSKDTMVVKRVYLTLGIPVKTEVKGSKRWSKGTVCVFLTIRAWSKRSGQNAGQKMQ